MEDNFDLRDQLQDAWRAVFDGAVAKGFPQEAVIETMTAFAHSKFSELYGPHSAASYLMLLAEQLREGDRREVLSLVRGRNRQSIADGDRFDPDWITEEPLL